MSFHECGCGDSQVLFLGLACRSGQVGSVLPVSGAAGRYQGRAGDPEMVVVR